MTDTEPAAPPNAAITPLRPAATSEPLTPREQEVARLLARGYTDRQIAAALAIAVSTVGVHVHHILAKLCLRSRWQLADWTAEHNLVEAARAGHEPVRPTADSARAATGSETG